MGCLHSQAAYHANRAAVALQLNNAAGAAEDAERALALSPDHVAARLRAAKACMALQHAEVRTLDALGLAQSCSDVCCVLAACRVPLRARAAAEAGAQHRAQRQVGLHGA